MFCYICGIWNGLHLFASENLKLSLEKNQNFYFSSSLNGVYKIGKFDFLCVFLLVDSVGIDSSKKPNAKQHEFIDYETQQIRHNGSVTDLRRFHGSFLARSIENVGVFCLLLPLVLPLKLLLLLLLVYVDCRCDLMEMPILLRQFCLLLLCRFKKFPFFAYLFFTCRPPPSFSL